MNGTVAYVNHVRFPKVELRAEKNETFRAVLSPHECAFQSKSAEAPSSTLKPRSADASSGDGVGCSHAKQNLDGLRLELMADGHG